MIPRRHRCAAFDVAEGDASLGKIVRGKFQRHLVTGEDADVVLAHLASGIGHQLVTILKQHAETGIRQDFLHDAVHFYQFFFGQDQISRKKRKTITPNSRGDAGWSRQRVMKGEIPQDCRH